MNTVVVVQSELSRVHKLAVTVDGKGINTEVPPHSITTFIVEIRILLGKTYGF